MPGKCVFNAAWTLNQNYKDWMQQSEDKHQVKCMVCNKTINIGSMGEAALVVHMKGKKHCSLIESVRCNSSMPNFFNPHVVRGEHSKLPSAQQPPLIVDANTADNLPKLPNDKLSSFVIRNEVIKAEIVWALKCISSHFSYKSCQNVSDLFSKMFPDSQIAKEFSCGEKKCAYLSCFGLAPQFKTLLLQSIEQLDHFVLLFDESMNSKTHSKQMDIHIRLWDNERQEVVTRFYTSAFMGHATAEDMINSFKTALYKLNLAKLLQLSMDGPSVNWKFHNMLREDLNTELNSDIINIGSCGLHITHNAFRHGSESSQWFMESTLSSMYYVFKDSPARQEDYLETSEGKSLPQKFCKCRWLDNLPVAERALLIYDDLKRYVQEIEKKNIPRPKCKSFERLSECTKDCLFQAKLHFFISISKIVQPYLTQYQSDKPLLPFFSEDTHNLVSSCLLQYKVLQKEVLKNSSTILKLLKLDFNNNDILNHPKNIEVGFATEKVTKDLLMSKKISEKEVFEFKLQCRGFVVTFIKKLLEKSPVNYALVRNLSFLDPRMMATNRDNCPAKLKIVLSSLVSAKKLNVSDCDDILLQYNQFLNTVVPPAFGQFKSFKPTCENQRLDKFLAEHICAENYPKLWSVVKMLLIMSHGQATVERGFSINRNIEVENLKEESYVAQRQILDHISSVGGIENVVLTKELIFSAAGARQKYMMHLEQQNKEKKQNEAQLKRRAIYDEIEELKAKKKHLSVDITELNKSADKLADKAEHTRQLTFISQSNSLRKTAREKQEKLNELDIELEEKITTLKK